MNKQRFNIYNLTAFLLISFVYIVLPCLALAQDGESAEGDSLFKLAPKSIEVPEIVLSIDSDEIYENPRSAPMNEWYLHMFSRNYKYMTKKFRDEENERISENETVIEYLESQDANSREILRFSSELFSETPKFKDVDLLLRTIEAGHPLFKLKSLNYSNIEEWINVPLDKHEEAISIYKQRFVNAFVALYAKSQELRDFFQILKDLLEKTQVKGANSSISKPIDHWQLDAMAREKANALVPQGNPVSRQDPLDQRLYRPEYDRVYHHWYQRYQISFENTKSPQNEVPLILKISSKTGLKLNMLLDRMVSKYLDINNSFKVFRLDPKTSTIEEVGFFSDFNDENIENGRLVDHPMLRVMDQDQIKELAKRKDVSHLTNNTQVLVHPDFDPNFIYFGGKSSRLYFSGFYSSEQIRDIMEENTNVTSLTTDQILNLNILFAIHEVFGHRYVKKSIKINDKEVLESLSDPIKIGELLLTRLMATKTYASTSHLNTLTHSLITRIYGESKDPFFWIKRDRLAEEQGLPSVIDVLAKRHSAWRKIYDFYVKKRNEKEKADKEVKEEDLGYGSNYREAFSRFDYSENFEYEDSEKNKTNQENKEIDLSSPFEDKKFDAGYKPENIAVFKLAPVSKTPRTDQIDIHRAIDPSVKNYQPWVAYSDDEYLASTISLTSLASFSVSEDGIVTLPLPRGYRLSGVKLTSDNEVLSGYEIYEDPKTQQIYASFGNSSNGFFNRIFSKPSIIPDSVYIEANYIPSQNSLKNVSQLNKDIKNIPKDKLLNLTQVLEEAGLRLISNNLKVTLGTSEFLSISDIAQIVSISSFYEMNWQKSPEVLDSDKSNFSRFSKFIQNGQFCGLCYTSSELGKEILDFLYQDDPSIEIKIQETFLNSNENPELFTAPGHAEVKILKNGIPISYLDFTASGDKSEEKSEKVDIVKARPDIEKIKASRRTEIRLRVSSLKEILMKDEGVIDLINKGEMQTSNHPLVKTLRLILLVDNVLQASSLNTNQSLKKLLFNKESPSLSDFKILIETIIYSLEGMDKQYQRYGRDEMNTIEYKGLINTSLDAVLESLKYFPFNEVKHSDAFSKNSGSLTCQKILL